MTHFIDDESEEVSQVVIRNSSDIFSFKKEKEHVDPFAVGLDDLKKVRGLGTNFKRKINRDFAKSFTGKDGSGTQQNLLQQAVTGYAMFDLVQPVYNLEYLSQIYEVSTYNYAAINAKVANIVGLGYSFMETRKTNDAIDAITDDRQLERARRKLNKLKQDLQEIVNKLYEKRQISYDMS